MSETPVQDDNSMPVVEHLDELRNRLIRYLAVLSVTFCITYYFSDQIMEFLEKPLLEILPADQKYLYFTGITDKFFIYLKVSVLAAVTLSSPYLLYETWLFVAPALKRNEKKFAVPFVFFGTFCFLLGISFGYYLVIPLGYKFLIEFGNPTDRAIITLTEYFDLTLKLMLAIGFVFELPVVLVLLGKFGIVNSAFLKAHRRFAFVASSVIAAIATPSPDAFTMLLVMFPLYLLYEISIVAIKFTGSAENP